MEEKELPEACKICIKLGGGDRANPHYGEDGSFFFPCSESVYEGGSVCLPKDRAMIVLLYKSLQARE